VIVGVILNILSKILDFLPDEDGSQILANASDESLEELAESHIDKKVWKNLKQAERQKIKYYRKKLKTTKKLAKLKRKGIDLSDPKT